MQKQPRRINRHNITQFWALLQWLKANHLHLFEYPFKVRAQKAASALNMIVTPHNLRSAWRVMECMNKRQALTTSDNGTAYGEHP